MRTYLLELFEQYVENGLQFVLKHCTQAIRQVDISKVTTLCSLLEALLLGKGGPNLTMVHLTQDLIVTLIFYSSVYGATQGPVYQCKLL